MRFALFILGLCFQFYKQFVDLAHLGLLKSTSASWFTFSSKFTLLFLAVESALLEGCFLVTIFSLREFTCWSFFDFAVKPFCASLVEFRQCSYQSLLCFLTYRADVILKFLIGRNVGPHIVS